MVCGALFSGTEASHSAPIHPNWSNGVNADNTAAMKGGGDKDAGAVVDGWNARVRREAV